MSEQIRTDVNEGATMCLVGKMFSFNTADARLFLVVRPELVEPMRQLWGNAVQIFVEQRLTDK